MYLKFPKKVFYIYKKQAIVYFLKEINKKASLSTRTFCRAFVNIIYTIYFCTFNFFYAYFV